MCVCVRARARVCFEYTQFFSTLVLCVFAYDSVKAIPTQAWTCFEDSTFHDNRHLKVVRMSALHTGRLYPPGNIPGTHFCFKLSRLQGHSAA